MSLQKIMFSDFFYTVYARTLKYHPSCFFHKFQAGLGEIIESISFGSLQHCQNYWCEGLTSSSISFVWKRMQMRHMLIPVALTVLDTMYETKYCCSKHQMHQKSCWVRKYTRLIGGTMWPEQSFERERKLGRRQPQPATPAVKKPQ